jgi:hypothetical protein
MIKEIRGGGKTNIECRISNVEGKRPFDALRLLRAASPFSIAIRTPKRASGLNKYYVAVPATAKRKENPEMTTVDSASSAE